METSFTKVSNCVEELLAHYKSRGMPEYAAVTGRLEMGLIFVLDYIREAHGEEAYKEAISRSGLKIGQ